MSGETRLRGQSAESGLAHLDVVWITAGLSCDGDTISITAATQPSIEDLILGAIPGIPRLRLHNLVLAYANGDDFMQTLYDAAEGKLQPFILVVEGSIPNEQNKSEGFFGRRLEPTGWLGNRSPPARGSIGWHRRRRR